jgi:MFS family permease
MKLPRRYLTVMVGLWMFGCVPLVVFGLTDQIWVMVVAAFLVGAAFNGGVVIWGTLLQRRVPKEMLGRVSSLDFFVSCAFMPISMAVAGPVGQSVGLSTTFLIAGLVPTVIGLVVIVAARLTRDEIAHPLETDETQATEATEVAEVVELHPAPSTEQPLAAAA